MLYLLKFLFEEFFMFFISDKSFSMELFDKLFNLELNFVVELLSNPIWLIIIGLFFVFIFNGEKFILFKRILGDFMEFRSLLMFKILLELKESIFKILFVLAFPERFKFLLITFFSLSLPILFNLKLFKFKSFGLKLDNLILNLFLRFFSFLSTLFSLVFINKVKCKGKSIIFLLLFLSLSFIKGKNSFLIFFFLCKFEDGDILGLKVPSLIIFHELFSMKNFLFNNTEI